MSYRIDCRAYAETFGPTVGDITVDGCQIIN